MASAASRPVLSWAPTLTVPDGKNSGAASTIPDPNKIVFKKERILHLDSRFRASGWSSKFDLRIVVLPPDLLPRQPFLLYPPSAAIEFEAIFGLSWRHLEIISLALRFCPAGVWHCSWTSRASRDGFGASPAAGLDGGDCHIRRAGTI